MTKNTPDNYRQILRDASRSENTRLAYNKSWQWFDKWCRLNEIHAINANAEDVTNFLIEMANNNLTLNTLKLCRSGLNDKWRRNGFHSPASDKSVDDVLRGLARIRGDRPRRVKAIREYQLSLMLGTCKKNIYGLRDAAILSLGFAAALRRSELCGLLIDDLDRKSNDRMTVCIRQSKTDKQSKGQKIAIIDGKNIKPIERVDNWLKASRITDGFVFQTFLQGGKLSGTPLDHGEVAKVVKRYVARIGLNPKDYSGHSLRAGFVTSAAAHHARIDKIMEITRHRNAETLMKYIRDENSFSDHAGELFL